MTVLSRPATFLCVAKRSTGQCAARFNSKVHLEPSACRLSVNAREWQSKLVRLLCVCTENSRPKLKKAFICVNPSLIGEIPLSSCWSDSDPQAVHQWVFSELTVSLLRVEMDFRAAMIVFPHQHFVVCGGHLQVAVTADFI